ncbi:MAG TPA: hypothetical protein VFP67_15335 [Acidimicrobiia bacterium]|nr:hypothetical protein [Acidimicrobiia bacterium]
MGDQDSTNLADRAFALRPVLTTWALTIGVDLFFNAGVFMSLFDQEREPGLLSDEQLFSRIPVAYLALLAGVTALAWLLDRIGVADVRRGIGVGALTGTTFAVMGVVFLWTALEMTGVFVLAGSLVVIIEFAAAGWVLSAFRASPDAARLTRRIVLIALLCALAGMVIQNLQG